MASFMLVLCVCCIVICVAGEYTIPLDHTSLLQVNNKHIGKHDHLDSKGEKYPVYPGEYGQPHGEEAYEQQLYWQQPYPQRPRGTQQKSNQQAYGNPDDFDEDEFDAMDSDQQAYKQEYYSSAALRAHSQHSAQQPYPQQPFPQQAQRPYPQQPPYPQHHRHPYQAQQPPYPQQQPIYHPYSSSSGAPPAYHPQQPRPQQYPMQQPPGPYGQQQTASFESGGSQVQIASCKLGDTQLKMHQGRDCSDFTEEEMDQPLMKWDYLTRWCKLAHRNPGMAQDQCYAQSCIGEGGPSSAALVWWETKVKDSPEWQGLEGGYCQNSGFCDDRKSLNKDSSIADMERVCSDSYGDEWKQATPRDVLKWLENPILGDNLEITCAWGTLHCDAARCQKYLCGDDDAQDLAEGVPQVPQEQQIGEQMPPGYGNGYGKEYGMAQSV